MRWTPARIGAVLAVTTLFVLSACISSDGPVGEDGNVSETLGSSRPCELLGIGGASEVVFGSGAVAGWTEQADDHRIGCDGRLSLMEGDDEVGSIDFTARVLATGQAEPEEGGAASYDALDGFQPTGQSDLNEILASAVDPISSEWDEGETYELDGLFRNRDLYIVGAWGQTSDFAVGVSIRFTAEQEYYDQPLVHHEYCESTDLVSGCLIEADVLYEWLTEEYLPAVFDRLSVVSTD